VVAGAGAVANESQVVDHRDIGVGICAFVAGADVLTSFTGRSPTRVCRMSGFWSLTFELMRISDERLAYRPRICRRILRVLCGWGPGSWLVALVEE